MDYFEINDEVGFSLDDYSTGLNNNMLIIGSPGTGKTTMLASNLLKMNRNLVVVDPKARLLDLREQFEENGYHVQVLDLCHPECSQKYDPMKNIKSDLDILEIARKVYGENSNHSDEYWDNSAVNLLASVIGYVHYALPEKKRTLQSVFEISKMLDTSDDGFNIVDLFDALENAIGKNYATDLFNTINVKASKTSSCIMTSLMSQISSYLNEDVLDIFTKDEINIDILTKEKSILFVTLKDTNTNLHRVANLILNDTISRLIEYADSTPAGRLDKEKEVMFVLDDFGTYCINDFTSIIANSRSRGINFMLLFQSLSQLEHNYSSSQRKIIIECCDRILFLGGNGADTIRFLSDISYIRPQALSEMPKGKCMFWERGNPSRIIPVKDWGKEEKYCIWNYPHKVYKSSRRKTKKLTNKPYYLLGHTSEDSRKDFHTIHEKINKTPRKDEHYLMYFSKDEMNCLNRHISGYSKYMCFNIGFKKIKKSPTGTEGMGKEMFSKLMKWYDYLPKYYFRNNEFIAYLNDFQYEDFVESTGIISEEIRYKKNKKRG